MQPSLKKARQYKSITSNIEIVRDNVGMMIEIRAASILLDCLEVIKPFVENNNKNRRCDSSFI